MEETSQDIGFTRNNQWFRYRAAGIIIKDAPYRLRILKQALSQRALCCRQGPRRRALP